MEVNAKILWMKTMTTLAINHFLETIEQHVDSALDKIDLDLLDLISVLFIWSYQTFFNLIFST